MREAGVALADRRSRGTWRSSRGSAPRSGSRCCGRPRMGRVVPGRLPGGRVASIVHIGPFDGLEQTYGLMHRWLAELGLQPTGPLWEVYWSDPEAEPDPATWRTEIFAPIE